MWVSGKPYWNGIQLDETAFVILLVELARREKALARRRRGFPLADGAPGGRLPGPPRPGHADGPLGGGSRLFASTMAVEIAALLVAADLADDHGEPAMGQIPARDGRRLERRHRTPDLRDRHGPGLQGGRGRLLCPFRPAGPDESSAPAAGCVDLKNHLPGQGRIAVADLVSPDALALVRFGLRAADDPRIVNTVRVIDLLCKVDTPRGPCWHRYNKDGYGEHADGAPFDGTGVGRAWPLLTGERAHYELAAGRTGRRRNGCCARWRRSPTTAVCCRNRSGTSPTSRSGSCSSAGRRGSAMPLVWAHAEYVKLRRSLHDGRVFDMPHQTVERYLEKKTDSPRVVWRFEQPCRGPAGGQDAASGSHGPGGRPLEQRRLEDDAGHADEGQPVWASTWRTCRRRSWPAATWPSPSTGPRPTAGRERFSRGGDGGRGTTRAAPSPPPSNGEKKSESGKKAKGKKKQRR